MHSSQAGWEGWGPELVINGHIAPQEDIGRWTTIPEPWDSTLHESRPVFFESEDVPAEDGRSGQDAMGRWFLNHTVEENQEMFPGLMSDTAS